MVKNIEVIRANTDQFTDATMMSLWSFSSINCDRLVLVSIGCLFGNGFMKGFTGIKYFF